MSPPPPPPPRSWKRKKGEEQEEAHDQLLKLLEGIGELEAVTLAESLREVVCFSSGLIRFLRLPRYCGELDLKNIILRDLEIEPY